MFFLALILNTVYYVYTIYQNESLACGMFVAL